MPVATEHKEPPSPDAVEDSSFNAGRIAEQEDNSMDNSKVEKSTQSEPTSEPQPQRTVIIFDWDDTLLPSSYLATKGIRLETPIPEDGEIQSHLKKVETAVVSVLSEALNHGDVHVITNAEYGWVELSAKRFMPAVVSLLNRVQVLSARSAFEHAYPEAPVKWKYFAFYERLAATFMDHDCQKNIISFGDSHVEREAVRSVTRGVPNVKTKSVKFAERPSAEQLQRQIELVTNCFQYLFSYNGDLDLMLTISLNV